MLYRLSYASARTATKRREDRSPPRACQAAGTQVRGGSAAAPRAPGAGSEGLEAPPCREGDSGTPGAISEGLDTPSAGSADSKTPGGAVAPAGRGTPRIRGTVSGGFGTPWPDEAKRQPRVKSEEVWVSPDLPGCLFPRGIADDRVKLHEPPGFVDRAYLVFLSTARNCCDDCFSPDCLSRSRVSLSLPFHSGSRNRRLTRYEPHSTHGRPPIAGLQTCRIGVGVGRIPWRSSGGAKRTSPPPDARPIRFRGVGPDAGTA